MGENHQKSDPKNGRRWTTINKEKKKMLKFSVTCLMVSLLLSEMKVVIVKWPTICNPWISNMRFEVHN